MIQFLSDKKVVASLFVVAAFLAIFFGLWTHHQLEPQRLRPELKLQSGFILPEPKPILDFELTQTDGTTLNNTSLHGHFTLMFFGFTHCPQMCPTTLSTLSKVYQAWYEDEHSIVPQMIFVSVDPNRDSLESMQQYVSSFHKDFFGAIGDESHLAPLKESLGILAMKTPMPGHTHEAHQSMEQDYNVDHSGTILVINPEGKLAAILTPPHEDQALAKDIQALLLQYYHPEAKHLSRR